MYAFFARNGWPFARVLGTWRSQGALIGALRAGSYNATSADALLFLKLCHLTQVTRVT